MINWSEKTKTRVIAFLAFIDVVTLVITLIIAFNQGKALDEAINRGCHNAGVLISQIRQQQAQSNIDTFRQFFPDVSDAKLHVILTQQRQQAKEQIAGLSEGCTSDQLGI